MERLAAMREPKTRVVRLYDAASGDLFDNSTATPARCWRLRFRVMAVNWYRSTAGAVQLWMPHRRTVETYAYRCRVGHERTSIVPDTSGCFVGARLELAQAGSVSFAWTAAIWNGKSNSNDAQSVRDFPWPSRRMNISLHWRPTARTWPFEVILKDNPSTDRRRQQ